MEMKQCYNCTNSDCRDTTGFAKRIRQTRETDRKTQKVTRKKTGDLRLGNKPQLQHRKFYT